MAYPAEHVSSSNLPLEQFNKSTPPGWRPGDAKYPLRRYEQLLSLWSKMTDLRPDQMGPAMAGRLRGASFQLAMKLTTIRRLPPTGSELTLEAADALSCEEIDEFTLPDGMTVVPKQPGGARILLNLLRKEYKTNQQNTTIASLDSWEHLHA